MIFRNNRRNNLRLKYRRYLHISRYVLHCDIFYRTHKSFACLCIKIRNKVKLHCRLPTESNQSDTTLTQGPKLDGLKLLPRMRFKAINTNNITKDYWLQAKVSTPTPLACYQENASSKIEEAMSCKFQASP